MRQLCNYKIVACLPLLMDPSASSPAPRLNEANIKAAAAQDYIRARHELVDVEQRKEELRERLQGDAQAAITKLSETTGDTLEKHEKLL